MGGRVNRIQEASEDITIHLNLSNIFRWWTMKRPVYPNIFKDCTIQLSNPHWLLHSNSEMGLLHFKVADLLLGLNEGLYAVVLRGVESYIYFTPFRVFDIDSTLILKIKNSYVRTVLTSFSSYLQSFSFPPHAHWHMTYSSSSHICMYMKIHIYIYENSFSQQLLMPVTFHLGVEIHKTSLLYGMPAGVCIKSAESMRLFVCYCEHVQTF